MSMPRVLAFVLAGGKGLRLHPLTTDRSKPAVPFGGCYRIIDFALSNLVNSNILSIYVLVQYKSQSLIEHLDANWRLSPVLIEHFIMEVPPQQNTGDDWFQGTANAVYQNLRLIHKHQPEVVAVLSADHIYRMDFGQMLDSHARHRADATLAATPVPVGQARAFGVLRVDEDGRIHGFEEKPARPSPLPGDPTRALASMGIYLFSTPVLLEILERAHQRGQHDFGHDVLPPMIAHQRVFAYDFASNHIPNLQDYEEIGYWRDVGTLGAYREAHDDILGARPRFELFNSLWPIHGSHFDGPPAKLLGQQINDCLIGTGTLCRAAMLKNCVIGQGVVLEEGVELENCIVLDNVRIGCGSRLRNVIVDANNVLEAGARLGFDRRIDAQRYHVDESGIVVVARGKHTEPVY